MKFINVYVLKVYQYKKKVVWLLPSENAAKVIWDSTMCIEQEKGTEIRELMAKAFKGPLSPEQQKV